MMPSLKAARAVTSLMVEHGTNPLFNASFWLTTLRTRPLVGSTTTTAPFMVPSASTAARRTVKSSPSTLSPSVGSTGGAGLKCVTFLGAVFLSGVFWTGALRKGWGLAADFLAGAFGAAAFLADVLLGAFVLAGTLFLLAPVGACVAAGFAAPAIWSNPTRPSKTGHRIFIYGVPQARPGPVC